MTATNLNFNWN